jgi:hypothetical protein
MCQEIFFSRHGCPVVFTNDPDCMVDTRPQLDQTSKIAANIRRPTYIPAMPWHHHLTLDSFLRVRKLGAFNTL